MRAHLQATFSICAFDPAAREVGCAVQSRYFSVGSVVPWAKAGVGAVATQAAGVAAESRDGLDRVCELRVEDHPQPIGELRRLVGIHLVWDALRRASAHHEPGRYEEGAAILDGALRRNGEDAVLLYDLACFECLAGDTAAALAHARRSLELDPGLRTGMAGDPDFAALGGDPEFRALIAT
jgi:uncharacterized Ntn-hydrolase superfamily protein